MSVRSELDPPELSALNFANKFSENGKTYIGPKGMVMIQNGIGEYVKSNLYLDEESEVKSLSKNPLILKLKQRKIMFNWKEYTRKINFVEKRQTVHKHLLFSVEK